MIEYTSPGFPMKVIFSIVAIPPTVENILVPYITGVYSEELDADYSETVTLTLLLKSDPTICPYLSTYARYTVGISPPLLWFAKVSDVL